MVSKQMTEMAVGEEKIIKWEVSTNKADVEAAEVISSNKVEVGAANKVTRWDKGEVISANKVEMVAAEMMAMKMAPRPDH